MARGSTCSISPTVLPPLSTRRFQPPSTLLSALPLFTFPSSSHPLLLPRAVLQSLLSSAKGLAIITVVRVGFLFTVRGGSGLIVARLPEGGWSAPTLIGLGGLGGGFEFGGEVRLVARSTRGSFTTRWTSQRDTERRERDAGATRS